MAFRFSGYIRFVAEEIRKRVTQLDYLPVYSMEALACKLWLNLLDLH